jgi:uncharacterized membrane protein
MVRQAALAVGVAVFVAIVGTPTSPAAREAVFHTGWWVMVVITLLGVIPTFAFIRQKQKQA